MRKILFILITLLSIFNAKAQNAVITGRIIDLSNHPISEATIAMLTLDSTFVEATISDELGNFELPYSTENFKLEINHLAFKSFSETFSSNRVGDIILDSDVYSLGEVTVKAHRPLVKVENGKLNYDLAQVAEGSTATNAYDALSRLPGVTERDEKLELAGMGGLTVIVNGKPSTMTTDQLKTMLRSMPIDRIESAELMYSAPPQYGVRGAAINLVVKKTKDHFYSGEIKGFYNNRHRNSGGGNASFAISTPLWSADMMYGYNNIKQLAGTKVNSTQTVNSEIYNISQKDRKELDLHNHYLRAAFDYTPSDDKTLSIAYNAELSPTSKSHVVSDGSFVDSKNHKYGDEQMHNISLRYNQSANFDIGIDYTNYSTNNLSKLTNNYTDDTFTSFDARSSQKVARLNAFIDKDHQLKNNWGINYGANLSWAEDKDTQNYSDIVGNLDPTNTNSKLKEWIGELYTGFNKQLKKGSLSVSLAGEYYNLQGKESWSLFPRANFTWMFNQNNMMQANLSSDRTQPSYWQIQNAISYVDGYTEIHGNPLLKPMNTYSGQLVYIHKQRYVFVLFGTYNKDYFIQNAYLPHDRLALIYKYTNFDYSRNFGANVMIPFNIGQWLNTKATLLGFRLQEASSDFFGLSFNRSKWVGVAKLDNTIRLHKNLSLEVNAAYQSPAIQGLFDLETSWWINAGLKLSMLDKKLNLTARCNNIFESMIPNIYQDFDGQKLKMYNGAYTRKVTVELSYTFGGYTKKDGKEVDKSRFGH